METKNKLQLIYKDYSWSNHPETSPQNIGDVDDSHFNRNDGNHMLHIITTYMEKIGYSSTFTASTLERIIRNKLPDTIATQKQVHNWLDENFKFDM